MQNSELAALMKLADQARTIDGAYQAVDPQRTVFLARLGDLREQASRGSITITAADAEACKHGEAFRTEMQAIIAAGRYFPSQLAVPVLNPREQAAFVLDELRHAGVEITAHPGGLTLRPASRVKAHVREQVAALREHVAALLDVLFIPNPPNAKA